MHLLSSSQTKGMGTNFISLEQSNCNDLGLGSGRTEFNSNFLLIFSGLGWKLTLLWIDSSIIWITLATTSSERLHKLFYPKCSERTTRNGFVFPFCLFQDLTSPVIPSFLRLYFLTLYFCNLCSSISLSTVTFTFKSTGCNKL